MSRGKSIKRQKRKSRRRKSVRKKKSRRRKSVRKRKSRRRKFRMRQFFEGVAPYTAAAAAAAVAVAAAAGACHYFNRPLSRESLVDKDWVELEHREFRTHAAVRRAYGSVPRPSGARKWYWFLRISPKDPDSQRTLYPSSGYGAESKNVDINTVEKSRRYNSTSVLYAMMRFFFPYLFNNDDYWADGRRINFSTDSSQADEFSTYSIFLKLTPGEFEKIQKLLREQWDISLYPRDGALGYLWDNLSDEEVRRRSSGVDGRVIKTSPERSYIMAGRFAKENIPELVKYENKLVEMYTLLNVLEKEDISGADWPRHVFPYL